MTTHSTSVSSVRIDLAGLPIEVRAQTPGALDDLAPIYARFATAYDAELREFVRRVPAGAPLDPGLDIGWKTLLVANLAEASARQGGRLFELVRPDGKPIESSSDAAEFAATTMSQLETP